MDKLSKAPYEVLRKYKEFSFLLEKSANSIIRKVFKN